MFHIDQTLLIRALNSTKQTYFPTYVGLRLIGDQLPAGENGYLGRMLIRRLNSGDSWRFKQFNIYKGSVDTNGKPSHIYRKCLAPSPLTAVAEALVLARLAADPAFQVPDRVFSYRWPRSALSGGSYAYFAEGYMQRNIEIAEALKTPGSIAVVTDIKGFYPSVDAEQVLTALKGVLSSTDKPFRLSADSLFSFYTQLLNIGGEGIPIGPASSHVLGHLVLKEVDKELTECFGKNYFRYVDDIVVVCSASDRSTVHSVIADTLNRYGFSVNAEKTAELDRRAWERSLLRPDITSEDNFRAFASDLTVYLAFNPDRADSLRTLFFENGLRIPVSRFLALSSYSRFRYFLRRRKAPSGLTHALSMWMTNNEHFLRWGLYLKDIYETSLSNLLSEPIESEPSLRRWQVQRIRRVLNTLFYLRDFSEWNEKTGQFDKLPELIEQRALAKALSSSSVDPVLPFYGRGSAAFSELWAEYGQGNALFEWPDDGLEVAEIDSLITLQLYGVISTEDMQMTGNLPQSRLVRIVNQDKPTRRREPDLSFDDEFESLRLGITNPDLSRLARTRYSLSEGTALEALTLMSSEYRS